MRAPSGIGKVLFTPDGRAHGRVTDVVFDLATGLILGYEITRPDLSRRMVPAIAPVREEAERIVVVPAAIKAATEDLSAL
ncbi:MAG TPA: PRC-barrel domain-containing protein, partial [Pantanalinema sp.]